MRKKHLKNLKNLEKNYTLKIFSNTAIEKVLEYFFKNRILSFIKD